MFSHPAGPQFIPPYQKPIAVNISSFVENLNTSPPRFGFRAFGASSNRASRFFEITCTCVSSSLCTNFSKAFSVPHRRLSLQELKDCLCGALTIFYVLCPQTGAGLAQPARNTFSSGFPLSGSNYRMKLRQRENEARNRNVTVVVYRQTKITYPHYRQSQK